MSPIASQAVLHGKVRPSQPSRGGGHIGIIVGDCATECEECGASVDMDTGEPYKDLKGNVVYCGSFGGRHIP